MTPTIRSPAMRGTPIQDLAVSPRFATPFLARNSRTSEAAENTTHCPVRRMWPVMPMPSARRFTVLPLPLLELQSEDEFRSARSGAGR